MSLGRGDRAVHLLCWAAFLRGTAQLLGLRERQGFAHAAGANPGLALQEAWTLTAGHLLCHWHCCRSALSAGEASAV